VGGPGSIVTQISAIYNNVLGTRFTVIYGYRSGPEMTLADPAFLEDAARQNLEIGAKSGEELQRMVTGLIEAPPAVLEQVRRAIQIKSAEAIRGAGRE